MAVHDTVGDFLTSIRNAVFSGKADCSTPYSKLKEGILLVMKEEGYIENFNKIDSGNGVFSLKVDLRYVNGKSPISLIRRKSRPSCRLYYGYGDVPRPTSGIGIMVLSTSKGVMKSSRARKEKLGGELLCEISS